MDYRICRSHDLPGVMSMDERERDGGSEKGPMDLDRQRHKESNAGGVGC